MRVTRIWKYLHNIYTIKFTSFIKYYEKIIVYYKNDYHSRWVLDTIKLSVKSKFYSLIKFEYFWLTINLVYSVFMYNILIIKLKLKSTINLIKKIYV